MLLPILGAARLNDDLIALTKHPIASARAGAAVDLAKLRADSDPAVALAARRVLGGWPTMTVSVCVRRCRQP